MAQDNPAPIDAIMVSETDNVATCLRDIDAAAAVSVRLGAETRPVAAAEAVPRGHKIAVAPIAAGEPVMKYGEVIGRASRAIEPGCHVHVHNVVD